MEPSTVEEWQDAIDAAHACLVLAQARTHGLVTGGPKVFVERCEELLRLGAEKGIVPSKNAVERFAKELA